MPPLSLHLFNNVVVARLEIRVDALSNVRLTGAPSMKYWLSHPH